LNVYPIFSSMGVGNMPKARAEGKGKEDK